MSVGDALASRSQPPGNFDIQAERFVDGDGQVQLGEWLKPGEICLAQNEVYASPICLVAFSENGVNDISHAYHAYVRRSAALSDKPRLVQFNTWEATYFHQSEERVKRLATEAANLGAERFVLDDGWFRGRNEDNAGLGDWSHDPIKYPDGLGPVIEHVNQCGMEFGLWIEPEMVNPDSDLHRMHPDWAIAPEYGAAPTGRHQLVLNLARADVRNYLFDVVNQLLCAHEIRYIKWDCNRGLYPDADDNGPLAHRYANGVVSLMARLRDAHPDVEFEACASGGARLNYGVLPNVARYWVSDATDPFERIRIQRRASVFFPFEVMGAHVGASPNHYTGAMSTAAFRAMTAFFGHFGLEVDPNTLTQDDKRVIKNVVQFYKTHRGLISTGRYCGASVYERNRCATDNGGERKTGVVSCVETF